MANNIKNALLPILMLNLMSCSVEKEAIITFISDKEVEFEIYDPIDGTPNYHYMTHKIQLHPNIPIIHKVKVDNFAYLTLKCPPVVERYHLLLLEGKTIRVEYSNDKINIAGENAEGNKYIHTNYVAKGLGFHHYDLIPWVEKAYTEKISFSRLNEQIKKWQDQRPYKNDLRLLLDTGKIDNSFYTITLKTLEICDQVIIAEFYRWMIQGQIKNYLPPKEEKDILYSYIDKIYSTPIMLNKDTPKYLFYFSTDYYIGKYRRLSEKEKQKLETEYEPAIFGRYVGLLLAPDYIRFAIMGNNAMYAFQSGIGMFDNAKLVLWFQKEFPEKEYTMILNKLFNEQNVDKKVDARFIEGHLVHTFKDLARVEELKGKKLYIDLWTSWCSPCIAQFKYGKQMHGYMRELHKDIVPVYISTDENDSIWKKQIHFHQLDGYHLRASDKLMNYLSKTLYKGQPVSVPRYLLIDETGTILDNDLPRPSLAEKLKKALDKAL